MGHWLAADCDVQDVTQMPLECWGRKMRPSDRACWCGGWRTEQSLL